MPDIFDSLQHFNRAEFNRPEHMEEEFLRWLDRVRNRAGIPFYLTSDGRSRQHNVAVGGWEHSLHIYDVSEDLKACAVDFGIPYTGKPWQEFWRVAKAVIETQAPIYGLDGAPRGRQLEIVHSDRDKHLHLGLFRDSRADELIVAVD